MTGWLAWTSGFFCQAEDGIRDLTVTGVQTCALPISVFINEVHYDNTGTDTGEFLEIAGPGGTDLTGRSEERRVGKECRSRWTPARTKRKTPNITPDRR